MDNKGYTCKIIINCTFFIGAEEDKWLCGVILIFLIFLMAVARFIDSDLWGDQSLI